VTRIGRVWRGEVPIAELVWWWLLFGGLAVNLSTTIGFLALISAGEPWWALFVGYGLSLPYNLLVGVGAWRSAGRTPAPRLPVALTRALTTGLLLLLSAT
jgi:hypothetical protein